MTRSASCAEHAWGAAGIRSSIGPVVRAIVLDALSRGVGQVLPTSAEYQERFGAGAGTVQRALAVLSDQGAVVVRARGHLGRMIDGLDVGQAWQAAGLAPVRLVLPPGGSAETDVLADTLSEQLAEHNVPHTERHERGANRRIGSVDTGDDDVAVVSAGAARVTGTAPTRSLGPGSYYARDRLVVVRRAASSRKPVHTVGIDKESYDHRTLTEAEFPLGEGFTYVPCAFTDIPAAVLRREIDAGVWHLAHSVIPLDLAGVAVSRLRRPASLAVWEQLSSAVLFGSPRRPELKAALAALDFGDLASRQDAAIAVAG